MNDQTPKNIYEFLARINERPGLYLGEKSITALRGFFDGYITAYLENDLIIDWGKPSFRGFNDWVADYFHYKESTAGWKNILLWKLGNEEKAFDQFFLLLEKYRQTNQP